MATKLIKMIDVLRANHVQVQIDADGHRIWVNVDGLCVCRVWAKEVQVDNFLKDSKEKGA